MSCLEINSLQNKLYAVEYSYKGSGGAKIKVFKTRGGLDRWLTDMKKLFDTWPHWGKPTWRVYEGEIQWKSVVIDP